MALVLTGVVVLGCIAVLAFEYLLSGRTEASDTALAILGVICCPIIGYYTVALRPPSGSAAERRPGLAAWVKGKVTTGFFLLLLAVLFVHSFNQLTEQLAAVAIFGVLVILTAVYITVKDFMDGRRR